MTSPLDLPVSPLAHAAFASVLCLLGPFSRFHPKLQRVVSTRVNSIVNLASFRVDSARCVRLRPSEHHDDRCLHARHVRIFQVFRSIRGPFFELKDASGGRRRFGGRDFGMEARWCGRTQALRGVERKRGVLLPRTVDVRTQLEEPDGFGALDRGAELLLLRVRDSTALPDVFGGVLGGWCMLVCMQLVLFVAHGVHGSRHRAQEATSRRHGWEDQAQQDGRGPRTSRGGAMEPHRESVPTSQGTSLRGERQLHRTVRSPLSLGGHDHREEELQVVLVVRVEHVDVVRVRGGVQRIVLEGGQGRAGRG
mmetsp:Transcript_6178/g.38417  ORF Transcript_6178/g.38417 Transcript_6178/m.38417 type:complete len:308 (+) Transcript_6178:2055-2978(+)